MKCQTDPCPKSNPGSLAGVQAKINCGRKLFKTESDDIVLTYKLHR